MSFQFVLSLALAGALSAVSLGLAADPLHLEEAVARALATHPLLAAESAELRALQARVDRESLPTPYVVGGDLENVAGTGALSGTHSAEATVRLGRVFELGGKRALRQAAGSAEMARQRSVADAVRLQIASQTTTRFIEVVADQERLTFATEQVAMSNRTRREVARWVAAARNPESDLQAAEIAVAEAELVREHAEHELASARTTLAASWGASKPDFAAVSGDLRELPESAAFETLAARLPQAPLQQTSLREADAIAARRRVAEAGAKPDVNVSLGLRRLEAIDDQGLVLSVSIPLGNRSRAALAVAEVDAQLAALSARREAQIVERQQDLFEKYQELQHSRTEFETLRTRILPKAVQALAFTRRGFEAGRFSFVALAQAQGKLFELRERSVEAAARYHTRLAEIERLTTVSADATP